MEDAAGAAVAEAAGADRVEICSALSEGGVTPSAGLVHRVLASTSRIGVQVLIRPRGGDFVFSPAEVEVMIEDVHQLRSLPRVGFVLGALSADGCVDGPVLERLVEACAGAPTTFHRAFDACRDLPASLEALVELGFDRVLTSGGAASALEGAAVLRRLTDQVADRLTILAGGGVRPANVAELVKRSGVTEVHGRAAETVRSAALFSNPAVPYDAAGRGVTSRAAVRAMRKALDEGREHFA
ncbi:copper homeostasis protein CutC [Kineosporia mesophila]|uniref:PF03932 family protein CutC n=1 Tax=Kineosporia mesophila TaxID=566012 RepID=A0ABP6ZNS2_9ACTN